MIQLLFSAVLAGHAVCGLVWWWLSPSGAATPADFWINGVLPFVPLALVAIAAVLPERARNAYMPPLLLAFPLFWMSFAIALRLTFPLSAGGMWNLPFAGAFVFLMLWMRQYRFRLDAWWLVPVLSLPAIYAGWLLPATQRSADPATKPTAIVLPEVPSGSSEPKLIKLSKEAQVHPDDGRLVMRRGEMILTVQPLLAFADRSPDRASTASADKEDRLPTTRKLVTWTREGQHFTLYYKDEDRSVLDVGSTGGVVELDARSKLAAPIWSHGNHLAEITVRGHKKLSIAITGMAKRIDVPSTTAPVRFAYVDASSTLHVVDCKKQNLGPFTEVASADLRGKPLELTLFDGDAPAFRVALADFVAQASTQASPQAGDGVPENVIEMVRGGEPDNAPVLLSLSLASTPIGRGTRSVGHAAGVYRDRISVQSLPR